MTLEELTDAWPLPNSKLALKSGRSCWNWPGCWSNGPALKTVAWISAAIGTSWAAMHSPSISLYEVVEMDRL